MSTLTYAALKREVSITKGKTILEHSIGHKVPHLHECGGHGLCTTCRVKVIEGQANLSPRTSREKELGRERDWDDTLRLACQARVEDGPVKVERMIWTNAETSSLQLETVHMGIGEERELAYIFCDMRSFTPMAEDQLNFDLAHILNRFFDALGDPVFMNNGVIYQYAGDEIIALFGVQGGDPAKVCLDATRAGLGMLYAIERLNRWELKDFDLEMKIGIGVHYGRAFVGNIGHRRHKQFAVIGDAMNVTSRIQGKNKQLGTELLISEAIYQRVPKNVLKLGVQSSVELKGKTGAHRVYEVLGFTVGGGQLLLQGTIQNILADEERFADKFYARVFAEAPDARPLFAENLGAQGSMLTHMLRGIVYTLSRPQYLKMGMMALGDQHRDYGVKPEHFPVVKKALLETIAEELGQEFNDEIRMAWDEAFDQIAELMLA